MRQALVFAVELIPFVSRRGELVDFGDLPLQALALLLALCLALAGGIQLLLAVTPVLPALADGIRGNAAVAVQQGAHAAGLHQALPGVLAMDIDQQGTEGAQLGGGSGNAVDPAAALGLAINRATQQDLIFIRINVIFLKQFQYLRGGVEDGADIGLVAAFAYQAGIGARAHELLQGVDQDRFAGTGFAREYGKAGGQLKVQRFDNDKILQDDASQRHGQLLPLFQCSFSRRVS